MLRQPVLSYLLLVVAGTLRAEANTGSPIRQTDPSPSRLSRRNPSAGYLSFTHRNDAPQRRPAHLTQVYSPSCREPLRLLKNSLAVVSDHRSGAEHPVFGRFEPDSRPQIPPAATFSTGWAALGSS